MSWYSIGKFPGVENIELSQSQPLTDSSSILFKTTFILIAPRLRQNKRSTHSHAAFEDFHMPLETLPSVFARPLDQGPYLLEDAVQRTHPYFLLGRVCQHCGHQVYCLTAL